jgi:hypothetical protein
LRGSKAHRPASIAKSAPAKDHAGFGGVHPKDRDDASDRADQQGRCAAQPLVNQLGDQNLVGGRSSNCFGLVPGQQLRAIAWRIRSIRACQSASCSADGGGGSIDTGIASLVQQPFDHRPGSAQLRTIVHTVAA